MSVPLFRDIYELRYDRGRIFVHANAAPKKEHQDRLALLVKAVQLLQNIPPAGGEVYVPFSHKVDVWDPAAAEYVLCKGATLTLTRVDALGKEKANELFGGFGTPDHNDFYAEWLRYE